MQKVTQTAIEVGLLNSGSSDDSIDPKYVVADVLEAGGKTLKSSTLGSFNKKARQLASGILMVDDDDRVEGLPAYSGALLDDDEDVETSGEDDESDEEEDGDSESDNMSDSDVLLDDSDTDDSDTLFDD